MATFDSDEERMRERMKPKNYDQTAQVPKDWKAVAEKEKKLIKLKVPKTHEEMCDFVIAHDMARNKAKNAKNEYYREMYQHVADEYARVLEKAREREYKKVVGDEKPATI